MLDKNKFPESIRYLIPAVEAELNDPNYLSRSHYNKGTYNAGCRGPLCKQAAADLYQYSRYLEIVKRDGNDDAWVDERYFSTDEEYSWVWFLLHFVQADWREIPPHLVLQSRRMDVVPPFMQTRIASRKLELTSDLMQSSEKIIKAHDKRREEEYKEERAAQIAENIRTGVGLRF